MPQMEHIYRTNMYLRLQIEASRRCRALQMTIHLRTNFLSLNRDAEHAFKPYSQNIVRIKKK